MNGLTKWVGHIWLGIKQTAWTFQSHFHLWKPKVKFKWAFEAVQAVYHELLRLSSIQFDHLFLEEHLQGKITRSTNCNQLKTAEIMLIADCRYHQLEWWSFLVWVATVFVNSFKNENLFKRIPKNRFFRKVIWSSVNVLALLPFCNFL